MCPACLTTLILAAGGTGSAGGLAVLAVKKLKDRKSRRSAAAKGLGRPAAGPAASSVESYPG